MSIADLRKQYYQNICADVLRVNQGIPNFADAASVLSVRISSLLVEQFDSDSLLAGSVPPQTLGKRFEDCTKTFLHEAFSLIQHLRPGKWEFGIGVNISEFEQYKHLAELKQVLDEHPQLASTLGGDYLVKPDIVVFRFPVSDGEINQENYVVDESVSRLTPLRVINRLFASPLLHASISCKWTIRSDRSQNVRTEALNLIRNRKGFTPRIAAVTAEPLPTRLASLALGTGDLDCVYHLALPELEQAVLSSQDESQLEMLNAMIGGNRLRDISDLPFDLVT
jgi:hypothetical protein